MPFHVLVTSPHLAGLPRLTASLHVGSRHALRTAPVYGLLDAVHTVHADIAPPLDGFAEPHAATPAHFLVTYFLRLHTPLPDAFGCYGSGYAPGLRAAHCAPPSVRRIPLFSFTGFTLPTSLPPYTRLHVYLLRAFGLQPLRISFRLRTHTTTVSLRVPLPTFRNTGSSPTPPLSRTLPRSTRYGPFTAVGSRAAGLLHTTQMPAVAYATTHYEHHHRASLLPVCTPPRFTPRTTADTTAASRRTLWFHTPVTGLPSHRTLGLRTVHLLPSFTTAFTVVRIPTTTVVAFLYPDTAFTVAIRYTARFCGSCTTHTHFLRYAFACIRFFVLWFLRYCTSAGSIPRFHTWFHDVPDWFLRAYTTTHLPALPHTEHCAHHTVLPLHVGFTHHPLRATPTGYTTVRGSGYAAIPLFCTQFCRAAAYAHAYAHFTGLRLVLGCLTTFLATCHRLPASRHHCPGSTGAVLQPLYRRYARDTAPLPFAVSPPPFSRTAPPLHWVLPTPTAPHTYQVAFCRCLHS